MKIVGINNQYVEIKIAGYEFPGNTGYVVDKNWLNVFLKVDSKQGKWEVTDPALTTTDLIEIKDWFTQIYKDSKPKESHLDFLEPNLSFEFIENLEAPNKVRVKFYSEFCPDEYRKENEYFVDFEVRRKDIERLVEEINLEVVKFPIRK